MDIKQCRKWFSLIVIILMLLPVSSAFAVVLKIATVSPEGATWMVKMRQAAKEIKKRTDNRVKFKFYSGGIMGSDESVLRKIRIGQLHGGAVTGGSLIGVYPDLTLYSLPYIFRSLAEVDAVRDQMDKLLIDGLEDKGFVTFGLAEGGFAYLMSNKAVRSAQDLKSQKVWVISGDKLSQTIFETASVSPIPLPLSDVMTGLQTGLIDTIATSPIAAIALQWHTRVKYLTDTPLSYFFALLTVSKKAFNKIPPNDQKIVKSIMANAFEEINTQNRIDNDNARNALQKQGVKFIDMPKEVLDNWKHTAQVARKRLENENLYSLDMLTRMQGILHNFRKAGTPLAAVTAK
jgi:TRAP-type C4-dicarboxylate transport system substrate-binding protein